MEAKLAELGPKAEARLAAEIALRKGDLDAAREASAQAIALDPDDPRAKATAMLLESAKSIALPDAPLAPIDAPKSAVKASLADQAAARASDRAGRFPATTPGSLHITFQRKDPQGRVGPSIWKRGVCSLAPSQSSGPFARRSRGRVFQITVWVRDRFDRL